MYVLRVDEESVRYEKRPWYQRVRRQEVTTQKGLTFCQTTLEMSKMRCFVHLTSSSFHHQHPFS